MTIDDIDKYLWKLKQELKNCNSWEELNEKIIEGTKFLNDELNELSYEDKLLVYNKHSDLMIRTVKIGDINYELLKGKDCDNCAFGELMSIDSVSKAILSEEWPCDVIGGCTVHYKKEREDKN